MQSQNLLFMYLSKVFIYKKTTKKRESALCKKNTLPVTPFNSQSIIFHVLIFFNIKDCQVKHSSGKNSKVQCIYQFK